MKLRNQIVALNMLVLMVLSLVVLWAVLNLVSLGNAADAILRENYRSISAVTEMILALDRISGGIDSGNGLLLQEDARFLGSLALARDNVTIEGEESLVLLIEQGYQGLREAMLPAQGAEQYSSAASPEAEEIRRRTERLHLLLDDLRLLNERRMYEASDQAADIAALAMWSTLAAMGIMIPVIIILSLVLSERIISPVYRLAEASRSLSRGDYRVSVEIGRNDELGSLAREFNQMARTLGSFHDMNIEQLIREKSKADAIISNIEDALVVFDQRLKVISINPAAQRLFTIDPLAAIGTGCGRVFQDEQLCRLVAASIEEGEIARLPDEERMIALGSSEGEPRHFQYTLSFIRNHDRSIGGVIMMLRDVTRLKELDAMKSDFVMAASHELKSPLTSIGLSIDLLVEKLEAGGDELLIDLAATAREEVAHMKSLTADLLQLARLEAGYIALEKEELDFHLLRDYIVQAFSSQLRDSGCELVWKIPDSLTGLHGDQNKLTWVLSNLISNALRYVPAQEGQIRVSAAQIGYNVHVSVADNGPGIPLSEQSRIFRKFSQISGRKSGGSGLGLAICREIVRAHGGSIWVESREREGSVFTFTLPVHTLADA